MLKTLSLKRVFVHIVWSISGGALALLLCNNHNLIRFSEQPPHTYIFWYSLVYVLASMSFLTVSFLKPKILLARPFSSYFAEMARSLLTINFLAIQGLSFYHFVLTDNTAYRLSLTLLFTALSAYVTWVGFGLLIRAISTFIRFVQFSKYEYRTVYIFTGISTLMSIVTNFFTDVFYQYDKVLSLDTGNQLHQGIINNTHTVYTGVRHVGESVITAPLGAVTTPLHSMFWFIPNGQHIITMAAFSLLIAVSSILIVRMLPVEDRYSRFVFHILYLLSFPVLLFCSMFEQYVPSVFFIVLCVFFLWTAQKRRISVNYNVIPRKHHVIIAATSLVLSGMGVLTSLAGGVLFLRRSLRRTIKKITLLALVLILFILMSGQLLTVVFGYQEYTHLQAFMGLGLQERVNVYSHFIINTFVNTSMSFGEVTYGRGIGITDSLHTTTTFNSYGALLFCLIVIGLGIGIYKKHFIAYASALWVMLSILVLVVFGWGASNNESTLYTYYFSFAFMVGFYLCVNSALSITQQHSRISAKALSTAFLSLTVIIALCSIFQYARIVRFGITHYPVDTRSFIEDVITPH